MILFRAGTKKYQIADLMGIGMNAKDIAARLNMKVSTVKTYSHQIYRHYGVEGRLEFYQVYNGQVREEETLP